MKWILASEQLPGKERIGEWFNLKLRGYPAVGKLVEAKGYDTVTFNIDKLGVPSKIEYVKWLDESVAVAVPATEESFETLFKEWVTFSVPTFKDATAVTSLVKLKDEAQELQDAINDGFQKAEEEYIDCFMCLLDSAARYGISIDMLYFHFKEKLRKNKSRDWKKNDNNTYSHIKK